MKQLLLILVNRILLRNYNLDNIQVTKKSLKKLIDFKRNKTFIPARVLSLYYFAHITAKTCLIKYYDGDIKLMLCPSGLKKDDVIISGIDIPISLGNHVLLKNIPLGTDIHNLELYPGNGGQLARASGACINVIAKESCFVTLRLPSGEVRLVSKYCWATIGRVDEKKLNRRLYKAGQNRWMGKRPHVRGIVKNPVDHPHGGGEGRSPIGRSHPVTPWGRIALGHKTRKIKKYSDFLILLRRK
uniref:Large ribosomal subunit protein uL2m n=1 Tax=Lotharella vacuolata TaxID=74820 RepID=A0A140JZS6_9EUKA|nr:50S ribosomal protein L2 [Lotharella vacuolata]BAU62603.1 50S ribosomal protein L2 [Lotharella vacuolata]